MLGFDFRVVGFPWQSASGLVGLFLGDQAADPLGKQGRRVRHENDQDIFVKPMQDGSVAVAIVNRGKGEQTMTLKWADVNLAAGKSAAVRDLWQHKDLGTFTGTFAAPVASHGTVMIRMK